LEIKVRISWISAIVFFFLMFFVLIATELKRPDYSIISTDQVIQMKFKGVVDYVKFSGIKNFKELGGTDKTLELGIKTRDGNFAILFSYFHVESNHSSAKNCSTGPHETILCHQFSFGSIQKGDSVVKTETGNKLFIRGQPAFVYHY